MKPSHLAPGSMKKTTLSLKRGAESSSKKLEFKASAEAPKRDSVKRLTPDLSFEQQAGYPGVLIGGADEVGRGCLAGPVVAAALVLPPEIDFEKSPWLKKIRDSKLLSAQARAELAPLIEHWAMSVALGVVSASEIDEINIFQASLLAMRRATDALTVMPAHLLVDGKWVPSGLKMPASAVIKGDLKCLSIAAASVVAKVWRDTHMAELHAQFPVYGFNQHKGYPTSVHQAMIKKHGVTPEHRLSFRLG